MNHDSKHLIIKHAMDIFRVELATLFYSNDEMLPWDLYKVLERLTASFFRSYYFAVRIPHAIDLVFHLELWHLNIYYVRNGILDTLENYPSKFVELQKW